MCVLPFFFFLVCDFILFKYYSFPTACGNLHYHNFRDNALSNQLCRLLCNLLIIILFFFTCMHTRIFLCLLLLEMMMHSSFLACNLLHKNKNLVSLLVFFFLDLYNVKFYLGCGTVFISVESFSGSVLLCNIRRMF